MKFETILLHLNTCNTFYTSSFYPSHSFEIIYVCTNFNLHNASPNHVLQEREKCLIGFNSWCSKDGRVASPAGGRVLCLYRHQT